MGPFEPEGKISSGTLHANSKASQSEISQPSPGAIDGPSHQRKKKTWRECGMIHP